MSGIDDKLKNVRTLEDIVSILAILFNNMNTLSRNYYDLFVNPVAMTIPMKLYDDNGVLVTKNIPNIATYRTIAKQYPGDPNGNVAGGVGAFCIDTTSTNLYYKATDVNGDGESKDGWKRLYDNDEDYLTVTGDGSGLTDLSTNQLVAGTLPIYRGGTGNNGTNTDGNTWTGLVYNDGTKYRKAVEGVDYDGPSEGSAGVVSYYGGNYDSSGNPINAASGQLIELEGGFLVCNGATFDSSEGSKYRRLGLILGGASVGDTCNLPNMIDNRYIKGYTSAGTLGNAIVGRHNHPFSGTTGASGKHQHNRGVPGTDIGGDMEIEGGFQGSGTADDQPNQPSSNDNGSSGAFGAFYKSGTRAKVYNDGAKADNYYKFKASRTWKGLTSFPLNESGSLLNGTGNHAHKVEGDTGYYPSYAAENDVRHIRMIPIIKY